MPHNTRKGGVMFVSLVDVKKTIFYMMLREGKRRFAKIVGTVEPRALSLEQVIIDSVNARKRNFLLSGLLMLISSMPKDVNQETSIKENIRTLISIPQVFGDRVILYVHGGGWVIGLLGAQKVFAAHLAHATNAVVFTPEYRLAPENPFPAGLEDIEAVYKIMLKDGHDPKKITVIGESAGGNLVLALLLKLKQDGIPLPGAAITMSAFTDFHMDAESYVTRAESDIMLTVDKYKTMHFTYLREESPDNPLASPIFGDLTGLPPLFMIVGGREILYDDTILFAAKATEAKVDVTLDIEEDMFHAYPIFYDIIDEAKVAMAKIALFIQIKTG
jgi:monoterpene epsilon-lactone hydrolase